MQSRMKRRIAIGYFNTELVGEWSLLPWRGALGAAKARDVDLLSFHGQGLGTKSGFKGQENIVFDLAREGRIDGLIAWKGHLTSGISDGEAESFYKAYGVPVVTIEGRQKGIPCITYGNYEGVKLIVEHLAATHKLKKIAYLGIVENHAGFGDRHRGYRDAMRERGLGSDQALEAPWCLWNPPENGRPVEDLLDEWLKKRLASGLEAIIGSCDPIATWAMKRLQGLGASVPYDVAVVGFDGFSDSRIVTPPLTTIDPGWAYLGAKAVETVLSMIEGRAAPEITVVPPRLVVAGTCGCREECLSLADGSSRSLRGMGGNRAAVADMIDSQLGERCGARQGKNLAAKFFAEAKGGTEGSFLKSFDLLLRESSGGDDGVAWQNALSVLARGSRSLFLSGKARSRAEAICHQARVLASLFATRSQERARTESQDRLAKEYGFGLELISNFGLESICGILASGLPGLGLRSAYVALYEDPLPYRYPDPAPKFSRLIFALDEGGRRELPSEGLRFESRRIIPDEAWRRDGAALLSVHALYFRELQIGFVAFDAVRGSGSLYNTLAVQISSALQGSLLLSQINRQYAALEGGIASLSKSVGDMVAHIGSISDNVARQSSAVEESASSVHEMKSNIDNIAGISGKAAAISRSLDAIANESIESIKGLLASIDGVKAKSSEVISQVGQIRDIADKTKLLALNASIQASRAGEHGRGFSVVSKEIRALAENADSSIEKVARLVDALNGMIRQAALLSSGIGGNLDDISKNLKLNTDSAGALDMAMQEQNRGAGEVLQAVVELVGITTDIKETVSAQVKATEEFKAALLGLNRLGTAAG